jgi:hypothetical protein
MKDREESHAPGPINVGDVQGTGIVIGHGSSASVLQAGPSVQAELVRLIDKYLELLAAHEDSVPDAVGLRESAEEAKAEAAASAPKWRRVRGLLRGATAGVAGIAALTDVVLKIEDLIRHFPA